MMTSFARMLLVATALLTSGVLQVASAAREDACCAGETQAAGETQDTGETQHDAPCPDCPPGVACGCCPIRGAAQVTRAVVVADTSPGVALVVAASEPPSHGLAADIFHPPRA
jgi:hypothetical protein